MSPEQWLDKASHADAQAEQLAAEGRIAEAVVESVRAQRYREVAEEMRRALTGTKQSRTVRNEMAVPAQTSEQWRKPPSMSDLARMLGCHRSFLTQARGGLTRIRKSWADRIATERPDLPATKKTWPKGWAPEEG
jgi:hypothetical protein